ncbi:MAG: SLBB domain-containing protein [Terracidiphilus sp.]
MPDAHSLQNDSPYETEERSRTNPYRSHSTTSLRALWEILARRLRMIASVVGGLLLLCLLYCLIAPNQYEATARVALRTSPASSLSLDAGESSVASSSLATPLQLETQANVFRSDQVAWRVITGLKLYQAPGFMGNFAHRFPGFKPAQAESAEAQAWLLERFQRRLHVESLPRTLMIQIRFRCRDAALSAAVVNGLIRVYEEQDNEARAEATAQASGWLQSQLKDLKARVEQDQHHLADFQSRHGILTAPETLANGQLGESQHTSALLEIDELSRQLVVATSDRILREAEYRAASKGNPELVIASDTHLQNENVNFATALLQQLHARHSALDQEQAQLSVEHGPNYPRVVEIRGQLQDIERQVAAEDLRLVNQFKTAWQTASDREHLAHRSLAEHTADDMKENEATTEYADMRQEANRNHELYLRVLEKVEEAGFSAGVNSSNITVVDPARQPVKPVAPDLPLYLAITLFAGLWLAVGGALLLESLGTSNRTVVALLAVLLAGALVQAQEPAPNLPTPSLDGLPTGVARIPYSQDTKVLPNPKDSPAVWNSTAGANLAGMPPMAVALSASPMAAPIAAGDFLDISEYRTPEFHSSVRVSPAGTVTLPMIEEVQIGGLDELAAVHVIEAALVAKGMLLHPQVTILVTAYAGQDVSVLGEVTHPGVYPYTLHHRLLDLISAASGLSSNAGRLVNIYHRNDPKTPHPVVLDPGATDSSSDHNQELAPGDTVQVSRAGLVYVVGDVIRPGGFPVDPAQGLTVVQALSMAWGPSLNAATGRALLIREQKGGRTMTTLNLKRMLHGQEPDQPVYDRDILYVPDSIAKNVMNRSIESAIQSAIGISIYSGLVYSQRY